MELVALYVASNFFTPQRGNKPIAQGNAPVSVRAAARRTYVVQRGITPFCQMPQVFTPLRGKKNIHL
jgi:hypothetical protein